jgi:hypothetical protein
MILKPMINDKTWWAELEKCVLLNQLSTRQSQGILRLMGLLIPPLTQVESCQHGCQQSHLQKSPPFPHMYIQIYSESVFKFNPNIFFS